MTLNRDRLIFVIVSPLILLGYCAALVGQAVRDFPREFKETWNYLKDDRDSGSDE